MKQLKHLTIGILALIGIISCSSDDDNDFDPNAYIEVTLDNSFMSRQWYIQDVFDQDGNSIIGTLEQCVRDNDFFFVLQDLKYEINESVFACEGNTAEQVLESGIYSTSNTDHTVTLTDNSNNVTVWTNVRAYQDNNGYGGDFKLEFTEPEDGYKYVLKNFISQ